MDFFSKRINERYEAGEIGQGETHERTWRVFEDKSADDLFTWPRRFDGFDPRQYPPELRGRRIPDIFLDDFLDCKVCRSLSFAGWLDHQRVETFRFDSNKRRKGYFVVSLGDLGVRWRECPICHVLHDVCRRFGGEAFDLSDSRFLVFVAVRPGFGGNGDLELFRQKKYSFYRDQSIMELRLCYSAKGLEWFNLPLDIRPFVKPQLQSTEAVAIIRQWLNECCGGHPECISTKNAQGLQLPKRLLKIGTRPKDPLKVITTEPQQHMEYIALSYCWGKNVPIRLTSTNLEDFGIGISWKDIPKTWKDAIDIASDLNIKHVWIDALCIIQDSPEDWAKEASKMAEIYQNAYLVIGASRADSVHAGFLNQQFSSAPSRIVELPHELRPEQNDLVLTICERSGMGDRSTHKQFWICTGDNLLDSGSKANPTFTRAWCLQEQYLATRMVHFTTTEMFWECRQRTWCQCGFSPREALPKNLVFHRRLGDLEDKARNSIYKSSSDSWLRFLAEYTKRELSNDADRLPALSGIAKHFQNADRGQYLAGIWQNKMPLDLLWYTFNGRRTKYYVAPTWSWACMEGEIRTEEPGLSSLCAEVIDAGCVLAGPDAFGQVKSGFICVRAPLIHAKMTRKRELLHENLKKRSSNQTEQNDSGGPGPDLEEEMQTVDRHLQGEFWTTLSSLPENVETQLINLDDSTNPPEFFEKPISLLILTQWPYLSLKQDKIMPQATGLILTMSDKSPTSYERIAYFSNWCVPEELLDLKETVTII